MQNLNEVYQSNPATSLQTTDLFYLVRWPYLPQQGDMAITWADILSAILYAISNDEFLPLSGGTMSGPINMGNSKINDLEEPTDDQDAVTKNYTDSNFLQIENNLSDLKSASTARTNLGLGTSATHAATDFLAVANNLSDLNSASTARTNLGVPAGSGTSTGTNTGDQTSVSGNAGSATTTATTDDTTTNATVYLVWKTAATGNLDEKVSSTKMSFNPSTGMLTVIGVTSVFIGNLTGNVTGNVSGSSGSCSGNAATATLAANVTTNANLTGPVTSTGNATAIANGAISNAMLANSAVANLSGTNTGNQTITLTGDVTGSGTGSFAATIGSNAVTYAKMQQASTVTLLGNPTGSPANIQQITLGTNLSFAGSVLNAASTTPPVTTKGDLYGYDTAGNRVPVGSNNQIIVADSTQALGVKYDFPRSPSANTTRPYVWDFLSNGHNIADDQWFPSNNGAGSGQGFPTITYTDGSVDGTLSLSTGTTTTGYTLIIPGNSSSNNNYRYIGGGQIIYETRIISGQTSTAVDRFQVFFGLGATTVNGALITTQNMVGIYYTDTVNSGQWTGINAVSATASTATGGSAVASATWYRLTIIINSAASSISYYVNGTLLGSAVTTNIPTALPMQVVLQIRKNGGSTGTTNCTMDCDYISYQKDFSTLR